MVKESRTGWLPGSFAVPRLIGFVLAVCLASAACGQSGPDTSSAGQAEQGTDPRADEAGSYSTRTPSRDGIGKVYMGREISHVMGHRGASWLERPAREREERTDLLIESLPLAPGDVVADIGAGTGYFVFPLAERVPDGEVLAVDIQPEMLAIIEQRMTEGQVTNVRPVLGSETDPGLAPDSVNLILIVDAYHEFSHPYEMGVAMAAALESGGRLVLVEYRGEDPAVPIKPLHKMTEAQVRREIEPLGLVWEDTLDVLPRQHILVFRKP